MQIDGSEIAASEKEIFKVSGKSKNEISSVCLNRRNLNKLFFHQKNARRDFLQAFELLFYAASDEKMPGLSGFGICPNFTGRSGTNRNRKNNCRKFAYERRFFPSNIWRKIYGNPNPRKQKTRPQTAVFAADFESETELVSQRLETLLAINRETARERELYSSAAREI